MNTITLFSAGSETNHTLTVPAGAALYWASRCCELLPGQLALVSLPKEAADLPYLGFIVCPDDGLAAKWLIDQYIQKETK